MPDVDVIVVGAGPAGACAALVLARAGRRVVLLERGPFPGSKNMYGGVVYPRVLDSLLPAWWDEAPVQRWVTRRSTTLLTDTQAVSLDFRTETWGAAPYNGATAYRPDWDAWLAGRAEAEGAELICSTTVTDLLRDGSRVLGVRTDRPDGELTAHVVIACDGVNSFLAKEAGLYPHVDPLHYTVGVKETLALPREVIDERFAVRGRHGVDMELLGCTGDVPGGGFLYTNLDTLAVGVVLSVPALAAQAARPEELIAGLKAHPAIEPLVEGAELKEYSAHLIPEGGYDMMPSLGCPGLLVAGDAAALCLAAGIWLEGVNFAMGSGMIAGHVVDRAMALGTVAGGDLPARYRATLARTFVLQDHRKLRGAPQLLLSERLQQRYPALAADVVERLFRVDNPEPKPGLRRIVRDERRRAGVRWRDLVQDGVERVAVLRLMAGQTTPTWPAYSFEERMATVDFRVHGRPHITVDGDACRGCTTKACVVACPAKLFVPTADGGILFNYEQCFECGTCYLACDTAGAITWTYPDGGHGVVFRRT